eukprot:403367799
MMIRKKETDYLVKLIQVLGYIHNDYKCGICHDLLKDPLECSRCSNIFCKKCIFKMAELKGTPTSCPFKCDNITYIVPSQILRRHIQNFQEIENEVSQKCTQLNVESQQASIENMIEEIQNHIQDCDQLYVSCKDCMFKVQRKDLINHASECDKIPQNNLSCNVCGFNIVNGHQILHLQECQNAQKCEVCNLKYDKEDDLHSGENCLDYMKLYNQEKEREYRLLQQQLDTTQKLNIDLVQKLAEERKDYKELIKCKGRVCNYCEKPIEINQQVNCSICSRHSCNECFPENMFFCYDCKRNFCKKCKSSRKTYVCDKHL